jgi:hypothetical protein
VSDGQIVIDDNWFSSLTDYIKGLIDARLHGKYILDKVELPHAYQVDDHPDRLLTAVYQSYLDGFDYHIWYSSDIPNGPKNVKIIRISDSEKAALLNKDLTALEGLETMISDSMESGKEYFVRLSSTSGKNEKAVRPFNSAIDIVKHLVSVKLFADREYNRDKETCLIMMPWLSRISNRCEFRIFVVNDRLTAASPQAFWELHQYSVEELEAFEQALSSIEFIGKVPYHTFVADVFIDVDTKICHLIELNPFGPASGAGASLFNWITDYDVLHGLPTIEAVAYEEEEDGYAELRYLSAINY